MTGVLELEVPLPPNEASPNNHAPRQARMRQVAAYRQLVGMLARQAARRSGWTPGRRVRLELVYRLGGAGGGCYRPNDPDNAVAAAKPLIDGLIDAGLIEDDSWRWLELGGVRCERDAGPSVLVRLEVIDE